MKTNVLFTAAALCALAVPSVANAQDATTIVVEETAIVSEVPCKTHYYVNGKDNWFIQVGAGAAIPFVEGATGTAHFRPNYTVGFGKWFSPYLGFRLSANGGQLRYDSGTLHNFNYVNANADLMWDMFNTMGGVNSHRVFSIIPFVGIGGTYGWHFRPDGNIVGKGDKLRTNSWTLPVSAGLQFRFRLCKYVDFFAEGRAGIYGDNFNNVAYGRPIDINLNVDGGFIFNIGGRDYKSYNPCDYLEYINNLNSQVNDLRGALATTAAALATAEAQLPCPEVTEVVAPVVEAAPLMSTVRFSINSAKVSKMEMVNVYNVAEYMKANPEQNVTIAGYADKDTGSSAYNMTLSKRRAQAVYDILVNEYGINPDRLSITAQGSDSQPYSENNWNRIVIFSNK